MDEVMDPYEWLPGYGENSVELRTVASDLVIDVEYERPTDDGDVVWRSITLHDVAYFCRSGIPEPSEVIRRKLAVQGRDVAVPSDDHDLVPLSSLVVVRGSHLSSAWSRHLSRPLEHFRIIFVSENVVLEAVASGFNVSEPRATRGLPS